MSSEVETSLDISDFRNNKRFLDSARNDKEEILSGWGLIAHHIVDVTIDPMTAESRASTLQTCPACGASFDTSDAEQTILGCDC